MGLFTGLNCGISSFATNQYMMYQNVRKPLEELKSEMQALKSAMEGLESTTDKLIKSFDCLEKSLDELAGTELNGFDRIAQHFEASFDGKNDTVEPKTQSQ